MSTPRSTTAHDPPKFAMYISGGRAHHATFDQAQAQHDVSDDGSSAG